MLRASADRLHRRPHIPARRHQIPARGQQILDALLGLLAHPVVDLPSRLLGGALEVHGFERRTEGGLGLVEVGPLEGVTLLAEEAVGDAQGHRAGWILQVGGELTGRLHHRVGCALQVQHLLHLCGRVAACARPGHGERDRDAGRRQGEVAGGLAQLVVERQSEGVAALRERSEPSRGRALGRRSRGRRGGGGARFGLGRGGGQRRGAWRRGRSWWLIRAAGRSSEGQCQH